MERLKKAWRTFAPFPSARGHAITIGAIPWEDLRVPRRVAPVYAEPLTIFQALEKGA